jgi:hypothetical protein
MVWRLGAADVVSGSKASKKQKGNFSGKVFLSIEQKIRCAMVCDAKVVECGISCCFTNINCVGGFDKTTGTSTLTSVMLLEVLLGVVIEWWSLLEGEVWKQGTVFPAKEQ